MENTHGMMIRDEEINALIKKSEFVITTSELTTDIYNGMFDEAKKKIVKLKDLLCEIEAFN